MGLDIAEERKRIAEEKQKASTKSSGGIFSTLIIFVLLAIIVVLIISPKNETINSINEEIAATIISYLEAKRAPSENSEPPSNAPVVYEYRGNFDSFNEQQYLNQIGTPTPQEFNNRRQYDGNQYIQTTSPAKSKCNPQTYVGCSGTELRAIQSGQHKIRTANNAALINRIQQAKQRADREASTQRRQDKEMARLEAQTRIEEAKYYSRQDYNINFNSPAYIPPRPKPYRPKEPEKPELKGNVYSKPSSQNRRVSSGN